MTIKRFGFGCLALALSLLGAACGGSDDSSDDAGSDATESASDAGAGGDAVEVSLFEWGIEVVGEPTAGEVTFTVVNDGGETHEMVIIKADDDSGFVIDETGKVDEDGFEAGAFIGEVEEFDAGTTETATFKLEAGTYILICNIVEEEDDGEHESHFLEGMQATLVVG